MLFSFTPSLKKECGTEFLINFFSFFSRIQMAARGRGRGRGAAAAIGEDVNVGMNGLEAENGNAVLNQAVEGMNAAMQAMQEMMQQQQQMFQQQQANQMQMFQQLLQANMAQMGAGQQAQAAAGGGNLNPPPPHLTPEEIAQERWLKTLERYKIGRAHV